MLSLRLIAAACVVLVLSHASSAAAQRSTTRQNVSPVDEEEEQSPHDAEGHLVWQREWTRFRHVEYGTTLALAIGVALVQTKVWRPPEQEVWKGPFLLEGHVRDAIYIEQPEERGYAVLLGDILWHGTELFPWIIDAGLIALAIRWSPDVAWQMVMITAQSLLFTGFVTRMTHIYLQRDRPYGVDCDRDPTWDPEHCHENEGRWVSFISGHTSMAFTGAGLACLFHEEMDLIDGGVADAAVCAGVLGTATLTGAFRMAADRHYLSDVLVGAGLGLLSGYLIPKLLHFTGPGSPETIPLVFAPTLDRDQLGLSALARF